MTLVLILFFVSLASLSIMIGNRVTLMRAGHIGVQNESPIIPDVSEVRYIIMRNAKRYGFIAIAVILRISIRSSIYVKKQSLHITNKIKDRLTRHPHLKPAEPKEVSGFLKTVSEYRSKIKDLKKKIREEESKY